MEHRHGRYCLLSVAAIKGNLYVITGVMLWTPSRRVSGWIFASIGILIHAAKARKFNYWLSAHAKHGARLIELVGLASVSR